MGKKRDRDHSQELAELRRKLTQDSADTVARMSKLQAEITAKLTELTDEVRAQGVRWDQGLGALIDLVADSNSDIRSEVAAHSEEIDDLKARVARLEDDAA